MVKIRLLKLFRFEQIKQYKLLQLQRGPPGSRDIFHEDSRRIWEAKKTISGYSAIYSASETLWIRWFFSFLRMTNQFFYSILECKNSFVATSRIDITKSVLPIVQLPKTEHHLESQKVSKRRYKQNLEKNVLINDVVTIQWSELRKGERIESRRINKSL